MVYNTESTTQRHSAAAANITQADLPAEYQSSREQLERLMAAPVKDYPAIDELIERLESLQLAIKGERGIKGNNPNE